MRAKIFVLFNFFWTGLSLLFLSNGYVESLWDRFELMESGRVRMTLGSLVIEDLRLPGIDERFEGFSEARNYQIILDEVLHASSSHKESIPLALKVFTYFWGSGSLEEPEEKEGLVSEWSRARYLQAVSMADQIREIIVERRSRLDHFLGLTLRTYDEEIRDLFHSFPEHPPRFSSSLEKRERLRSEWSGRTRVTNDFYLDISRHLLGQERQDSQKALEAFQDRFERFQRNLQSPVSEGQVERFVTNGEIADWCRLTDRFLERGHRDFFIWFFENPAKSDPRWMYLVSVDRGVDELLKRVEKREIESSPELDSVLRSVVRSAVERTLFDLSVVGRYRYFDSYLTIGNFLKYRMSWIFKLKNTHPHFFNEVEHLQEVYQMVFRWYFSSMISSGRNPLAERPGGTFPESREDWKNVLSVYPLRAEKKLSERLLFFLKAFIEGEFSDPYLFFKGFKKFFGALDARGKQRVATSFEAFMEEVGYQTGIQQVTDEIDRVNLRREKRLGFESEDSQYDWRVYFEIANWMASQGMLEKYEELSFQIYRMGLSDSSGTPKPLEASTFDRVMGRAGNVKLSRAFWVGVAPIVERKVAESGWRLSLPSEERVESGALSEVGGDDSLGGLALVPSSEEPEEFLENSSTDTFSRYWGRYLILRDRARALCSSLLN